MNPRLTTMIAPVLLVALLAALPSVAQEARKVKSQVRPELPDIARQMKLKGTVRLEVEIAPDGSVKATKALGGHPVLIQSAERAVRQWRFERGPAAKTVVEIKFHEE